MLLDLYSELFSQQIRMPYPSAEHTACLCASPDAAGAYTGHKKAFRQIIRQALVGQIAGGVSAFILSEPNWFTVEAGRQLIRLRKTLPVSFYVVTRSVEPFRYNCTTASRYLRRAYAVVCSAADGAAGLNRQTALIPLYADFLAGLCGHLVCFFPFRQYYWMPRIIVDRFKAKGRAVHNLYRCYQSILTAGRPL